MILTFDTETNGLPKNWKAKVSEVDAWPRITQLAWSISHPRTGALIREYKTLIKPNGWTIPTVEEMIKSRAKDPHFFVNNNMSTERCEEFGRPLPEVLEEIRKELLIASAMVAHNMAFDEKILGAEFVRAGIKLGRIIPKFCTKELSTAYCKVPPYKYGKYKWPKLEEAFTILFGKNFDGAHDAGFDVTACREVFHELVRLNVIDLTPIDTMAPESNPEAILYKNRVK